MVDNRTCTRCLLRDMIDGDMKMIEKYKSALKHEDQADAETYESRLAWCEKCDNLNAGTCMACGCYVEIRAAMNAAHCPKKKW